MLELRRCILILLMRYRHFDQALFIDDADVHFSRFHDIAPARSHDAR